MRWLRKPSPTPSRRTGLGARAQAVLQERGQPLPVEAYHGRLGGGGGEIIEAHLHEAPAGGLFKRLPAKARFQGAEEFGKQRQAGRLRGQIFAKGALHGEGLSDPVGAARGAHLPPGEVEKALSKHPKALREGWKIEGAEIFAASKPR